MYATVVHQFVISQCQTIIQALRENTLLGVVEDQQAESERERAREREKEKEKERERDSENEKDKKDGNYYKR